MHTVKFLFGVLIVSIASQCTLSFSSTLWGSLLASSTKDMNGGGSCAGQNFEFVALYFGISGYGSCNFQAKT